MDDALLVGGFERFGNLAGDRHRILGGHRPARHDGGEVVALDELHHQRAHAARFLDAVDRGDVGVVDGRQRLRLAGEAGQAFGVAGQSFRQHLQCGVALQVRVARPIDLAHPTGPERRDDLVRPDSGTRSEGLGWHEGEPGL